MLFATPHILIFVALLLMHGVQITGLNSPRKPRGGGGDDSGHASSSTSSINTSPSKSSSLPTSTSASTSLSSSASTLATSTPVRLTDSRQVSTIVGSALGSVILAGLGLMTIAHFRRRARIARKQPQGSPFFNESVTEMSQTRNGPPLTSSAPLIRRPAPLHFFNDSSTNNSSLLPLLPAATLSDSLDAASSLDRSLSTCEFNSNPDAPVPSISGHSSPFDSSLLQQRAVPSTFSSTSDQLSPLHRDMAGFQKTLEADLKGDINEQSHPAVINDDPPPKYIG